MTNKTSAEEHYELLFIIPNKYTEDEVKKIVDNVQKIIEKNQGEITYSEFWGKKKFSYNMQNFSHGYYSLFEFNCAADRTEDINKELRLSNEVLRHMMVAKKMRTKEEIESEKKQAQAIIQKQAKAAQEKKAKQEKSAAEKKTDKKGEDKVNLKDLDEKLDKILETDDLL